MGQLGTKGGNAKSFGKINQKRMDKVEREKGKIIYARMEEQVEAERKEWTVTEKDDVKFQKKLAKKMEDTGPSQKELNKKAYEEEMAELEGLGEKKAKKAWGKK